MANDFDFNFPPNDLAIDLDFGLGDHTDSNLFGDNLPPRGVQIGGGRRREEDMLDKHFTPTKLRPKITGTKALLEAIPLTKDGKTFMDRVSDHRQEIEQGVPNVPGVGSGGSEQLYHSPLHLPQSLPNLQHRRTPSGGSQMSMALDAGAGIDFSSAQSAQGFAGYGMQHISQPLYPYQVSGRFAPHGSMSPNPPSPMMHASYPGTHLAPLVGPGGYMVPSSHHGLGLQPPQFEGFQQGYHPQQLAAYMHLPQSRHPSPMETTAVQPFPSAVLPANDRSSPPPLPPNSPHPPAIHVQTATPLKPTSVADAPNAPAPRLPSKSEINDVFSVKGKENQRDEEAANKDQPNIDPDSDIDIHPFSDSDDDGDDENRPLNKVSSSSTPGSSKSPGGRPSKIRQKIISGYVEAIQKLARAASSETGLSVSFVITQALDPNDPRFGNCWNTWQRGYFAEFREEELKRIDVALRPAPGEPVSPHIIRLAYKGFMEQHGGQGRKYLRAWEALKRFQKSNMTVQQRISLFNKENKKIKQIMDNLAATFNFQSALISTGGVVNQDQGICTTYETTMAEGFLKSLVKNKDEEVVRGLFRSHVYGKVAQQHLEGLEENTDTSNAHSSMSSTSKKLNVKENTERAHHTSSVAQPSETPDGNDNVDLGSKKDQENAIRDCLSRLFGSKSTLKHHVHPKYMWKALGGQLAKENRRLTLYNWPESVGFPSDATNNKGLADLTVEKRAALFKATKHPEFPLSKREWAKEGTIENMPVIQCVPAPGKRALCIYANRTTAYDGQTLEELRSGRPAPLHVPSQDSDESDDDDDGNRPKNSTSSAKPKPPNSKPSNDVPLPSAKPSSKSNAPSTPATPSKASESTRQQEDSSDASSGESEDTPNAKAKHQGARPSRYSPKLSSPSRSSRHSYSHSPFSHSSRRSPSRSSSRRSPSRSSSRRSPSRSSSHRSPSRSSSHRSPSRSSPLNSSPSHLADFPVKPAQLRPEVVINSKSTRAAPLSKGVPQTRQLQVPQHHLGSGDMRDVSDKKRDRRSNQNVDDDGSSDVDDKKRSKRSRKASTTSSTQLGSDGTMHHERGDLVLREETLRNYPPYTHAPVEYGHHSAHPTNLHMHAYPPVHQHLQPPSTHGHSSGPAYYYHGPQSAAYVPITHNHYATHNPGPYPPHYSSPFPPYHSNYGPPPSHAGPSQKPPSSSQASSSNSELEYQRRQRYGS